MTKLFVILLASVAAFASSFVSPRVGSHGAAVDTLLNGKQFQIVSYKQATSVDHPVIIGFAFSGNEIFSS